MRPGSRRKFIPIFIGISLFILISYLASLFRSGEPLLARRDTGPWKGESDCFKNIEAPECIEWNQKHAADLRSLRSDQISSDDLIWWRQYLKLESTPKEENKDNAAERSPNELAGGSLRGRLFRPVRAARQRPSIELAKRPRGRFTSTTSTIASTQTVATTSVQTSTERGAPDQQATTSPSDEEEAEEEREASDDYEPINEDKKVTTTTSTTTTPKPAKMNTTPAGMGRKKTGNKKGKSTKTSTTTTTTTTTSTTSTPEPESEEEEEEGQGEPEAEPEAEPEEEESASKGDKSSGSNGRNTERARGRGKSMAAKVEGEPKLESGKESIEKAVSKGGPGENNNESEHHHHMHHLRRKPLFRLPILREKNHSVCIPEAFLEFPADLIGDKWRSRGFVLVHILVVCYMFYSLAVVCERYFMPSLEEFAQRLNLSEDVAGATLMSAGSSAPELFTALLGVFVAKGDVGTGAIVGSAVFNILFVIGICAFVSTTTAQLQWWPVLRDSVYYTFTVLVLILIIYDERITALESFTMIALYGVYIVIMANNEKLKETCSRFLASSSLAAYLLGNSVISSLNGMSDDVFGSSSDGAGLVQGQRKGKQTMEMHRREGAIEKQTQIEDDSMYLAALLVIMKHKRLFRSTIRFQSAARYVIIKMQHRAQQKRSQMEQTNEMDYFEAHPVARGHESGASKSSQRAKREAYAHGGSLSKNKFSIVSRENYEFWNAPPAEDENYYLWLARIPVNYVLHYTIPDCTLYPDRYMYTFFVSILWTAVFSYIMVWMVTLIGYTFGIPDSVMGVTFLAAGTSVPDCYSSIHAARNGMADMAVSNSIGSNVFDILIGLAVPWFIQSAIYPGVVATINSRGIIYSVILLFLSLIVTIYLMNKYDWNLQPRLGLALLIAYGLFIILTCMLEFDLFGHVNPPPCQVPANH